MRVLLDENLPHDLIATLVGHEVHTVQGLGWAGTLNGELLRRASGVADVFVTMDRTLERQHDLTTLAFGVVVVSARSNQMPDLLPLVESILAALGTVKPGQVAHGVPSDPWYRLEPSAVRGGCSRRVHLPSGRACQERRPAP